MRKVLYVYYDDILDKDLIESIDKERGSISRSKYILMKMYKSEESNINENNLNKQSTSSMSMKEHVMRFKANCEKRA